MPLLCSPRIPAEALRQPLAESPALRRLVEQLLAEDWLWIDVPLED